MVWDVYFVHLPRLFPSVYSCTGEVLYAYHLRVVYEAGVLPPGEIVPLEVDYQDVGGFLDRKTLPRF